MIISSYLLLPLSPSSIPFSFLSVFHVFSPSFYILILILLSSSKLCHDDCLIGIFFDRSESFFLLSPHFPSCLLFKERENRLSRARSMSLPLAISFWRFHSRSVYSSVSKGMTCQRSLFYIIIKMGFHTCWKDGNIFFCRKRPLHIVHFVLWDRNWKVPRWISTMTTNYYLLSK